ncbi:hypothetical protein DUNSADRAFT_16112 [Dunaliella salina]|uniref:Uncharacterized protein n=1 Tax=Dunaliella salina TaxID=3046 RepID=A0ABQ7H163_DUNSA|nr:hypothetical protein DUNSADRAFT_16112 [Dunaliella salina]|eukprot:KAF5840597.1 hypothetical protein DUNSADRAFT_16112 [Dunaliella salina]
MAAINATPLNATVSGRMEDPIEHQQEQGLKGPLRDGLEAVLKDQDRIRDLYLQYKACPKKEYDVESVSKNMYYAKLLVGAASQHMSAVEKVLYPMIKWKVDPRKGAQILHDMVYMESKVSRNILDFLDSHYEPKTADDFLLYDEQMGAYTAHLDRVFNNEKTQVVGRLSSVLNAQEKDTLFEQWVRALGESSEHPYRPPSPVEKVVQGAKDTASGEQ